jgi:exosortase
VKRNEGAEEPVVKIESLKGEKRGLWTVLGLAALVGILYAPVFQVLVTQWWEDPNYGHGFLVPLFSGYILWRDRERWLKVEIEPANTGLPLMIFAVALLFVGTLGAELYLSRFSLLLLLAGLIIYLRGWRLLRALAFPLSFLILMIPLPGVIYYELTFPLQLLASRFAGDSLELLRVPVLREGNLLVLPNYTLEVVEACSGIRSLMSLVALAVAYGYLAEPRRWIRFFLVLLMVPIAIVSNGLRVMVTSLLTYFVTPRLAEGFFHEFSGLAIFITAMILMLLAHGAIRALTSRKRGTAHA